MARIPVPEYERSVEPGGDFVAANAQGGQLTSANAQAAQQLGEAGNEFAVHLQRMQNNQAIMDASKAASKFKLNQQKALQDMVDNAPNGGAGSKGDGSDALVPTYLKQYDAAAQDAVKNVQNPRAQKYLSMHIDRYRSEIGASALHQQYQLGKSYQTAQMLDSINNSAQIVGAPGGDRTSYKNEIDTNNATIDAIHGLTPMDKQAMKQHNIKTITDAYWTAMARDNPQSAVNILRGQVPQDPKSPQAMIVAEAKQQGVDPRTALAVSSFETGGTFDPGIANPKNAQARGLFQMIDSTWSEQGGTPETRDDPAAQAKFGVKNLARNQKALTQTIGRAPTPGELYMTQFGLGFATAMMKAPETTPAIDVVSRYNQQGAANMLAVNGMAGMTVGQVRQHWDQVIAQHMVKTAGFANAPDGDQPAPAVRDPNIQSALANTPVPQQMQYLTHAETQLRKDDSEQKSLLTGRMNDTLVAYQTFRQAPNPPTYAEIAAHYPASVAAKMYGEQLGWQQFAYDGASVATQSPAQQAQLLKQREPTPGDGYADSQKRYEALRHAVSYVNEQRQADPVAFDQQMGLKLTKPLDLSNPQTLVGQLSARYEQSDQVAQQFGTPYTPLSKSEASALGNFFASGSPGQVQDYLASARVAAGNKPEQYMALLGQVAPSHPVIAVAGAIADQNKDAATLMVQGDKLLHPQGEKKEVTILLPKDDGAAGFRQAWHTSGADAAYGDNQQSEDAAYQAAKAYYVAAQAPGDRTDKAVNADLWKKAVTAATGGVVDWPHGKTLPPYGMKPADFPDAVAKAWPTVAASYGLDPREHPVTAYSLDAIGPGQYRVSSGTSVLRGANGQSVVFDLNKLQSMPAPEPLAPQAVPAKGKRGQLTMDDVRRFRQ